MPVKSSSLKTSAAKKVRQPNWQALLNKVGATRRILVVVDNKTPELVRASNNLGDVKLVQAKYVNVFDAMNADSIVFTNAALAIVSEWLSTTRSTSGGDAPTKGDGGTK
jgi:ribosomal protein L4